MALGILVSCLHLPSAYNLLARRTCGICAFGGLGVLPEQFLSQIPPPLSPMNAGPWSAQYLVFCLPLPLLDILPCGVDGPRHSNNMFFETWATQMSEIELRTSSRILKVPWSITAGPGTPNDWILRSDPTTEAGAQLDRGKIAHRDFPLTQVLRN